MPHFDPWARFGLERAGVPKARAIAIRREASAIAERASHVPGVDAETVYNDVVIVELRRLFAEWQSERP